MNSIEQEVRKAVEALGYKDFELAISHLSIGRIAVFVDGDSVGIYDMNKHTFVD